MLQCLTLVGNLTGLVQVEIAVTHELRMHTQVFEVRFSNESSQGIGHTADAELQRVPVVDEGEYLGGNLLIQSTGSPAGNGTHGLRTFYDGIDVADVDMVIGQSINKRCSPVDFHDDMFCCIEDFLSTAVGQAVAEISIAVHGRYGHHGHIDRRLAAAVIGTAEAEHHGRKESPPFVDILPVQTRAVPDIIRKGLLIQILFDDLYRPHRNGTSYLHIGEFIPAGRQSCIEIRRKRAGLSIIDPVTGLDKLYCFFGSAQFFLI